MASLRTHTGIVYLCTDCGQPAYTTPAAGDAAPGSHFDEQRGGVECGWYPLAGGLIAVKRALFLSAFASLLHPPSRAYYERKISEGKRHNQALLCLARRRCDVLYAMIRNGAFYDAGPAHSH